jgi:putative holliday junction resolvase
LKFSGRIMGLDLGRKRVGVALSDETATIASPLVTIAIRDRQDLAGKVGALVAEHRVAAVVVGYPSRLDGTDTGFSARARQLTAYLGTRLSVPVHQYDERFTSAIAQQAIHRAGKGLKGNKDDIDKVAAAVMLSDYLKAHHDH